MAAELLTWRGWIAENSASMTRLATEMTEGLAVVSDCRASPLDFLDHARVALSSGHVFGIGGAGHVRISFATSRAILIEAVSRMGRCYSSAGSASAQRQHDRVTVLSARRPSVPANAARPRGGRIRWAGSLTP